MYYLHVNALRFNAWSARLSSAHLNSGQSINPRGTNRLMRLVGALGSSISNIHLHLYRRPAQRGIGKAVVGESYLLYRVLSIGRHSVPRLTEAQ